LAIIKPIEMSQKTLGQCNCNKIITVQTVSYD
jgi:hypothetical protein